MSIISWQWRWPQTKKCEIKTISFSAGLEVVLPPDSLCPDSLRACSYDQILILLNAHPIKYIGIAANVDTDTDMIKYIDIADIANCKINAN